MDKKIAFVETNPPNKRGVYTKCNDFEPYGLELLAGIANKEGFDVRVYQQNGRDNREFEKEILDWSPDTLAFSSMAFNFDSALALAKIAKNKRPSIKVIIGGSHISSYPKGLEQALKDGSIDFGIRGEADYSFKDLINSLENPDLNIPGLIYLQDGEIRINDNNERIRNLDDLPFALRDPKRIPTKLGKIMHPSESQQIATTTLSYSRGCPFACSYCDSRSIWGNNVVWRSAKNVVDEMQELEERYGTNTLFFSDLTFNANPKKVHELCDEIINRGIGINWYILARVATPDGSKQLIDKPLLEKMREANCIKVGYGLESITPEIQEGFHKRIPNTAIENLVEEGNRLGMLNKGFLIMGDPEYESPETIKRTLDELKRIEFDEIRLSMLTPFPGSPLYERAEKEGILLTKDLSKYTTDEQILKCKNLTPKELKDGRKWLASSYYQSEEYNNMAREKVSKFPEFTIAYKNHQDFLRSVKLI